MKRIFNLSLFTSLLFSGSCLIAGEPAHADFLKDLAIGATGNTATGALLNNGSILQNVVGGAATGAAVSATHNQNTDTFWGILQDAAVGAATNALTGAVLNNGNAGNNAIQGAATGVLINVTK